MQDAVSYYRDRGEKTQILSERFQIIDEIRKAKELFDELNETLTASWELMYEKAKQYYKTNGHLNVPRRYRTQKGHGLGNWIFAPRKIKAGIQYGNLGEVRITKHEQIGMVWDDVRNLSW